MNLNLNPHRIATAALALFALAAPGFVRAQGLEHVKANYTKYEYRIPMRDGVRLFTSVYVPKDVSKTYPILMTRTPYSARPYGVDQYKSDLGPSSKFGRGGYIFVYQDVRGAWMSEGEFVNMRPYVPNKRGASDTDETSDAYDTIDWLLKNVPNHNGRVGAYGISYPGFYTSTTMIDAHPSLVAASPQAPICDWFVGDDFHHNGALFLPHAFNFLSRFGHPRPQPTKTRDGTFDHGTPDGYEFFLKLGPLSQADGKHLRGRIGFWNEMLTHERYDDFWKARNLRPHLKNVRPAVLTVGGWFDAENLFGALQTYRAVESQSPNAYNVLVMGPWFHGGWSRSGGDSLGHVRFDSKTSDFYQEEIEFPFFETLLKGDGKAKPNLPEAYVFETGRNQWRKYDAWPPKAAKPVAFYLRDRGALAADRAPQGIEEYDEYLSDPNKPVPFLSRTDISMAIDYMVDDQRHASRRPDVLTYQTEPLEQDLTLAGPIKATLYVSTTGTDSDWVVKLIDVYPDDYPDPTPNPTNVRMGGYQQLVRGDIFRGKFREGYDHPKPFVSGEPTKIEFTINDINHAFRPGHRIMVQIQSSWFPLADRNPQTFVDIPKAAESDFRKATQRVFRAKERASRLEMLQLP